MDTTNQTSEQVKRSGKGLSVLTGMLVGSLAGAVAALLLAPQPGAKTRAEIQQGVEHLRERTTETMKDKVTQVKSKANQIKADVVIKAEELQHQGKDLIAKQLDRVSHAAEAGKQAIQNS